MIMNGVETESVYNAKLMSYELGIMNTSNIYNVLNHNEYLLRGRPYFAPCILTFMIKGSTSFDLHKNFSNLRAGLEKSVFVIINESGVKLTCHGVYNGVSFDEEFTDFMSGMQTQKVMFQIEVFRKVGALKTDIAASGTNDGTLPAKPIITVTVGETTATPPWINISNKRAITFSSGVTAGQVYVINTLTGEVKLDENLSMQSISTNTFLEDVSIPQGSFTVQKSTDNISVKIEFEEVYL